MTKTTGEYNIENQDFNVRYYGKFLLILYFTMPIYAIQYICKCEEKKLCAIVNNHEQILFVQPAVLFLSVILQDIWKVYII